MHIGSGTDLEHLAQVVGAMEEAAFEVGRNVHSISVGGGLPIPYRDDEDYVDLAAYFDLWNAARRPTGQGARTRAATRDRARPLSRRRKRLSDYRDPGDQADGQEHFLSGRRRLQ